MNAYDAFAQSLYWQDRAALLALLARHETLTEAEWYDVHLLRKEMREIVTTYEAYRAIRAGRRPKPLYGHTRSEQS